MGAYRWLSDNYEEDDCIYLFGMTSQNDSDLYGHVLIHARVLSWSVSSSSALGDD